ncbi:hypothetical protein J437_LFUL009059 [Ladona fulva]|uniref:Protein kinase domain-containing protein n=1 Tax=Ladona fulva TaxID=123851 RepID=A0A8K0K6K6_LADFU|nr:hypothetical protein J437_LFUL009059 [Ladona fulva]
MNFSKLARPLGRKRAKGGSGENSTCDTTVVISAEDDASSCQRRRDSKNHRLSVSERSALHKIPEPVLPEIDLDLSPCPQNAVPNVTSFQNHSSPCEYDVVRTLAEGCFARVLLARRRGAPVSLKAVHAELTSPRDFYRELHYSIRLGAHPGIVTTYEGGAFVVRGSASSCGTTEARSPVASISRHPSANSGTTSGYASYRLASLERPTPTKGIGQGGQLSPQGCVPSTPSGGPPPFTPPLPAFYVMTQEVAPLGDLSAHVALWCKAPLWRRGASPSVRGRSSVASLGMLPEGGMAGAEAAVKRAARQLSSALSFMHDAGVVHRDLKLENVLVFAADLSLVKICDLGSARRSGTLVTKVRTTWSAWVPPEVRATLDRERYECRPASDAFQLGLLISTTLAAAANATSLAANSPAAPAPQNLGAMKTDASTAAATGGSSWWWARRNTKADENRAAVTKACRRGSVPRAHRASVTAMPAPLEIPARFRRYSARFLRLARRLLDPDPETRSPVSEVYKYLDDPWLDRAYYPASPNSNSVAPAQVTQSVQRPLVKPPEGFRRASMDNRSARSRGGNATPRNDQCLEQVTNSNFLTVPQAAPQAPSTPRGDGEDEEEEEFYEFEDECWDAEGEEDEDEEEEELDPSRRKLRRMLAACGVESGTDRYTQAQKRLWSWVLESQPGEATEEDWGDEGWHMAQTGSH